MHLQSKPLRQFDRQPKHPPAIGIRPVNRFTAIPTAGQVTLDMIAGRRYCLEVANPPTQPGWRVVNEFQGRGVTRHDDRPCDDESEQHLPRASGLSLRRILAGDRLHRRTGPRLGGCPARR
jgi:hypothetical protein